MILGLFLSSPTPISLTDVEEVVSNKVDVFVFISLEEVRHDELIFLRAPLATTFPILSATFESTATFLPLFLTRRVLDNPATRTTTIDSASCSAFALIVKESRIKRGIMYEVV